MRIAILFTGGTIGSSADGDWVRPDPTAKYMLLWRFQNRDGICFEPCEPYTALSEQLNADKLNRLQEALAEALATNPDGVIVTHGTDTLHYSAAAAALAFSDAAVPIVFVSAAYPLNDPRTNGHRNFEGAVAFIRDGGQAGVFVSYQNRTEDVTVHAAHRLLQHAEGSAELYSLDGLTVASFDGVLRLHRASFRAPPVFGRVPYVPCPPILTIESRPEERYAYALDGIRAILLKPYHSATLNTDSEALAALCREAYARHIPVFVCGVKSGPAYESSARFAALHIRIAPYSTFVSLFMTLWAAISLGIDPVDAVEPPR